MRRIKWVWLIVVIVLVGVRCSGEAIPTGVVAPQNGKEAVATLSPTLTSSSPENVIPMIGFEGSEIVHVGERTLLNVKIWGTYPISELTLEIRISLDSLQINTPAGLTRGGVRFAGGQPGADKDRTAHCRSWLLSHGYATWFHSSDPAPSWDWVGGTFGSASDHCER